MKIQQLKYVLAVADNELNITEAAHQLHTCQPAVSKQIKLLEEELGVQLFVRHGKSLRDVTSAGGEIIRQSRVVMWEFEKLLILKAKYRRSRELARSTLFNASRCRRNSGDSSNVFQGRRWSEPDRHL